MRLKGDDVNLPKRNRFEGLEAVQPESEPTPQPRSCTSAEAMRPYLEAQARKGQRSGVAAVDLDQDNANEPDDPSYNFWLEAW